MALEIRAVDYFYTTVTDQPGAAYHFLSQLAGLGVNLIAFAGVPIGPLHTQLTLFPEESKKLSGAAASAGISLDGPHPALMVRGDDQLGALAEIHEKLADAAVNVFASNGVTDGVGHYCYIIYVRPEEYDRALAALGV